MHELASRHPGQQIVVVAHGGVLDTLYRIATRQEVNSPRTWQLPNGAINRLLWTPQGFTLVGWSDTQHLDHAAGDENTSF
jgi:probable phosphoglycerate mutase